MSSAAAVIDALWVNNGKNYHDQNNHNVLGTCKLRALTTRPPTFQFGIGFFPGLQLGIFS